jgi:hypothetical protein
MDPAKCFEHLEMLRPSRCWRVHCASEPVAYKIGKKWINRVGDIPEDKRAYLLLSA